MEPTYHCNKCGQDLVISAFLLKRSGGPKFPCRDCRVAYNRERLRDPVRRERVYAANRRRYVPKARSVTPAEGRFWAKVNKTEGCWEWTGAKNARGYGDFYYGTDECQHCLAHRFSYALAYGEMPDLCVLHRCDNPSCVRPDHLFLGTRRDNSADMMSKGRQRSLRGEQNARRKLTWAQVNDARSRFAAGETSKSALARELHVTHATVRAFLSGRTWKEATNA